MENTVQKNIRHTSLRQVMAAQRGMTIVELMIVMTIIASIMGVIGFSVFGALGNADKRTTAIEINKMTEMVNTYYMSSSPRQFPNSLEDLATGPSRLTEKINKDAWGNDYIFKKISNREFEILSAGPDGSEGTEDDISSREKE